MAYRVAAIDVHKMVLIVAVATAADEVPDAAGEALEFECRRFGAMAEERQHLIAWLEQRGVSEVVMESTAQYWKPVWLDLEPHFAKLHLAQAQSNRAPKVHSGARTTLSGVISDLLGVSGRRILTALAQGETDPVQLSELGDDRLQCDRKTLIDALRGSPTPIQLQILKLHLKMLGEIDSVIGSLDQLLAEDLKSMSRRSFGSPKRRDSESIRHSV